MENIDFVVFSELFQKQDRTIILLLSKSILFYLLLDENQ